MMNTVERTDYVLESRCCGTQFPDGNWELECPKGDGAALIFARYAKKQLEVRDDLPGLYKYADWLPICRILEGSGAPITYKSEGLSKELGLSNLYVTFNGYWPEKGARWWRRQRGAIILMLFICLILSANWMSFTRRAGLRM